MDDVFTKAKRSVVMSLIRSRGNRATELRLIALMREYDITGWRRNAPVFGKPDFIFRRERLAVFVDGCFWHGCPKHGTRPKQNRKFWDDKIARNRTRDRTVNRELRKLGWRVVRIWEHELSERSKLRLIGRLRKYLSTACWPKTRFSP
jgi:DNA mismatch endonuclease (patch repair protein)